jgi:hypothetical protein
MTSSAHAEHKMLITDVLDRGEFEAQAEFNYLNYRYDYTLTSPVYQQGEFNEHRLSGSLSIGAGIINGLQVGLTLPYVFDNQWTYDYLNPSFPSRSYHGDGAGDLSFGARYRIFGGSGKPYTLVAGINIKPETADSHKAGTGTTNVMPYLAVSTSLLEGKLRPYAEYEYINRNNGAPDDHTLTFGAEYTHNRWLTLVPEFHAKFRTDNAVNTSIQFYHFELQNRMEVFHNFYLVPGVGYTVDSDYNRRNNSLNFTGRSEESVSFIVYYLFN